MQPGRTRPASSGAAVSRMAIFPQNPHKVRVRGDVPRKKPGTLIVDWTATAVSTPSVAVISLSPCGHAGGSADVDESGRITLSSAGA